MKSIYISFVLALCSTWGCLNGDKEAVTKPAEKVATTGQLQDQAPTEASNADTPMARDLIRICDGEKLSGALELPLGDRAMHTAIWLASNMESQAARDFSASIRALPMAERIVLLNDELSKHAIEECDIIGRWADFDKKTNKVE
ncbi:MAG: hypothetical protein JKY56_05675 [Kofleriaceae bacterium]|nr:hypothetical protein [Kofleriaceae bacterium]